MGAPVTSSESAMRRPARGRRPKVREVVAGDELTHDGARGFLGAVAADGDGAVGESGLDGGEGVELGEFFLQLLPGIGREKGVGAVIGFVAGVDAAIVGVPQANKGRRVGNGEVAQEDGVDQGENSGVGADAESQSEDGGGGEAGSSSQLSQRIAHVLHQGDDHRSVSVRSGRCRLRVGGGARVGGGPLRLRRKWHVDFQTARWVRCSFFGRRG